MPNVVRTVAMCTIINNTWPLQQFLVLCYCLPVGTNFVIVSQWAQISKMLIVPDGRKGKI